MTTRGIAALLTLTVTGCGGPPEPPSVPDPADPPDTAPDPPAVSPGPAPGVPGDLATVLTEQDSGRHVSLRVNERLALRLDNAWLWGSPLADGTAVEVTRVHYESDPGFQEWSVTAVEEGAAEISVQGEPNCPDPEACAPRTVELRVRVGG